MNLVLSVSQVNSYISGLIRDDVMLSSLEVRGELSNVKYNPSGHIYFTIKDGKAALSGVMFAGDTSSLTFRMSEGMQVIVSGSIGVYERSGTYQIYARKVRREGSGELYERFLKLKEELSEMGMFDEIYKQPIPRYISRLGVVTASTGAAVRDIINISKRRDPYIQIILYPAKVQGEGAAESVAKGIRALDAYGVDTIIIGRGGGSIEDLWAFNEEIVARAVFECHTPVISAVGHETDTTISDFAADLRAPTPSAAAELAVFDYSIFLSRCRDYDSSMHHYMNARIDGARQRAENVKLRLHAAGPFEIVRERRMRLDRLDDSVRKAMQDRIDGCRMKVALYAERLKGVSPLEKLSQGYSFVEDSAGKPVSDAAKVKPGDMLKISMKNGKVYADVRKVEKQ